VGVITLALAKLSLVLLFNRIATKQIGPRTFRWLMPMVPIYTLLSLALIAFQCQLPRPWVLSPTKCYTHGNVYYPITISNMVTDALLAVWIFPVFRSLHMRAHTKSAVLWLFGSRILVCVADIVRMMVIHKALQSEDQTRKTPFENIILLLVSLTTS
jgi:small basic protein